MTFDKHLRKLHAALRTLDGTEDRLIARRNARRRVWSALRAIRATVDAEYPAYPARRATCRLTPQGRIARLQRAGWTDVSASVAGAFAAAGVRVRRVVVQGGVGGTAPYVRSTRYYVPEWAYAIGPGHPARLRAAKRSAVERRVAIATAALAKPET